jgi:hypothetical protein
MLVARGVGTASPETKRWAVWCFVDATQQQNTTQPERLLFCTVLAANPSEQYGTVQGVYERYAHCDKQREQVGWAVPPPTPPG